jgi:hypothetical protein
LLEEDAEKKHAIEQQLQTIEVELGMTRQQIINQAAAILMPD